MHAQNWGTTAPSNGFIRIPHALIDDPTCSDAAVTVYAALANHPGDIHGWIRKPHQNLAQYLGWTTPGIRQDSATKRVARAIKALVAGGWLQTSRVREGLHMVPTYRVLGQQDAQFEALPRDLFTDLTTVARGRDGSTLIRHWLYWRMSAGNAGWVAPNVTAVAQAHQVKRQSLRQRLKQLIEAGWIRLVEGIGGAALRFEDKARSVHQPGPEVSTSPVPKCPASSRPAPDELPDSPSVGASATTVQTVTREHTADKPPTTKHRTTTPKRGDQCERLARQIVNAQPLLAGHGTRAVRLRAIALIAKQLRLRLDRGETLDWQRTSRYVADRLEDAALVGEFEGAHCRLIRQALANERIDALVVDKDETPTALPVRLHRPEAAPAGPTLDDLAAERMDPAHDSIHEYATWWLASLALDALAKSKDVTTTLTLGARVLQAQFSTDPTAVVFAQQKVLRALQQPLTAACTA